MAKVKLKDIVILLPGIQGSVLSKNGKKVWSTPRALGKVLNPFGSNDYKELIIKHDDPFEDDLGDGITATSLMKDFSIIPGLFKIDGYSKISKDIRSLFEVTEGDVYEPDKPANFFEFPYDWRRTNRYSAFRLKRLIDTILPIWRNHPKGYKDAQVILVGHSMGGLVSRYYLEVLNGWKDCKALITIATPHRGSVNSANFLVNGYKKLFMNLTKVVRSLPAVYELLPIYEMLGTPQGFKKMNEVGDIPHIDSEMMKDGLRFHKEIEEAYNKNSSDIDYLKNGYELIPLIGVNQSTYQSATFVGNKFVARNSRPPIVPSSMTDGDGTVPSISAIPIELSKTYKGVFYSEKHASLQNNKLARKQLFNILNWMQNDLSIIRSKTDETLKSRIEGEEIDVSQVSLSLNLEDAYLKDEEINIDGVLKGLSSNGNELRVTLESLSGDNKTTNYSTVEEEGKWNLKIPTLPAGAYRVQAAFDTTSIQDIFCVC